MKHTDVPKATLGRIPTYLRYLKSLPDSVACISATMLAKELGLGEVQVRKDLGVVSGAGKPKIGYRTAELAERLEAFLRSGDNSGAVIVGAGKLGRALLDYGGFSEYGLSILAAFDNAVGKPVKSDAGKDIFPLERLQSFCRAEHVSIGVITVPAVAAQEACDCLTANGVRAIWSFAPCPLTVPPGVVVRYENMALSLAHLKTQIQTEI